MPATHRIPSQTSPCRQLVFGRAKGLALAAACVAVAASLAGCADQTPASGVDLTFLTAPLQTITPQDKQTNLLPLHAGNSWQMRTVTRQKRFTDTVTVAGTTKLNGRDCARLLITRDGRPWRSECYLPATDRVLIAASKDETSPEISFDPPIPLVVAPFTEGQTWEWNGILHLGARQYPGYAFSRVSAMETITTTSGVFKAYRVDTVVILKDEGGHEVRFPSVRWLAPDAGFIRRGFADQGQPAFSELLQFNVH